ncbi:exodeoxyribonuclease VII large subunit [Aurantiacibacter gangjinensis]|uniref:Exodeoxyribonuclease 7 large subunit n=1 Tax=Aurantiacibacter gangjinensis TaxID=502682 RepID=A0A0G9MLF0_9SPHN|nr:exodeoxyribonuclease VII large subunit [Aurantiacibacter gangjinensis]APE27454.1 Exodeoxyribonuclease VII large subunit [Aurantiacibacter gangjinensis]KLE31522.1 exodeoxyribonuclease VII large subunit [Aurantiacibacter gangjinensis]
MNRNSPFDDDSSDRLVATSEAGDNSAPLSISEISAALKRTVEDRFGYVRLRGELSGVKRAASGHVYLALKDEKAVLDGVMWKGTAGRLAFRPEDGLEVVATGKLTTYPGRSKYQIVIERMEIAGEGALLALLEKTKARLEAEGLFAPERKRALPFAPRTIGVVTSPTGAVIRDILHRLEDRFPTHVIVWPVLVQGEGAAKQVADAVRGFGALEPDGSVPRPDLLIVARGGGSIEDLWSFNEEMVVRAVAESPIPVISAVGHETDTTLCDYAADKRAPTPTAAAEMAVPVLRDLVATLDDLGLRQRKVVMRPVELGRERLAARADRLPPIEQLLQPYAQRLDDLGERLRRGLVDRAAKGRERLADLRLSPAILRGNLRDARQRLASARLTPPLVQRPLADGRQRLAALERLRLQLDPKAPLKRGYALVSAEGHPVIASRDVAAAQSRLTLEFADGSVQVAPGDAPPPAPATPRPKKRSRPAADDSQGKLL